MGLDGGMEKKPKRPGHFEQIRPGQNEAIDELRRIGRERLRSKDQDTFEKYQDFYAMDARSRRGWLDWILDYPKYISDVTMDEIINVAHEDALQELEDRNRKGLNRKDLEDDATRELYEQHRIEYAQWEKMLKTVVDSVWEQRRILEENKKIRADNARIASEGTGEKPKELLEEKRILLYIPGGGMAGIMPAFMVQSLNQLGIRADTFHTIAGTSAGGFVGAYYLSGVEDPRETQKGVSIYYENCTTPEFINPLRLKDPMSIKNLVGWMHEGEKKLNEGPIYRARKTGLYFGVVEHTGPEETPKAKFIDAKTAVPEPGSEFEDSRILSAARGSGTVPFVNAPFPKVNGIEYFDGAYDPMPIQTLIDQFNPTDILVLPTEPFDRIDEFKTRGAMSWVDWMLKKPRGTDSVLGQLQKFTKIKERMRQELEFIQKQRGVNIGILWPPSSEEIGPWERNQAKLMRVGLNAALGVFDAFRRERPEKLDMYVPDAS